MDTDTSFDTSTSCSSEDEIVWGVSDEFSSESSLSDFIILPRVPGRAPIQDSESDDSSPESDLSLPFDLLSIATSSKVDGESHEDEMAEALEKLKCEGTESSSDPYWDTSPRSRSQSPESDSGAVTPTSSYEHAAAFITQYLDSAFKECRKSEKLRFLQALVVELGISEQMPTSINSVKKLLKREAHINIKEYIAVRGKGQDTLRQIMHPSISALRKSIRKSGKRKSLKWVKEHGLEVFLIGCYETK